MLAVAAISLLAVTIHAKSFSTEDQAIWIDRHNYFRSTGLPWSAGNMRRMGWSDKLATSAASTASKCSSSSGPGVNVYKSPSSSSPNLIDDAIDQWVVTTSESTLKLLTQPGANNVDIGTGTYNSYSQILWASTTSVGCATHKCPSGDVVVCEYSPAGNDGSSPWYNHADTASNCPSGTKPLQGLCIVEGDPANDVIAPIPAGKLTYEVYPSYVLNIQAVLLDAARAKANTKPEKEQGSIRAATTTPSSKSGEDTEDAMKTTKTPVSGAKTPPSTKTTPSTSRGTSPSSHSSKTSPEQIDSAATKSGKETSSTDSEATKTPGSSDGKDSKSSSATPSSESSKNTSIKKHSIASSSGSDEMNPGKVKTSSASGSGFSNQPHQAAGSTPPTSAPSPPSSSGMPESISNKSSVKESGGISATGVAGIIVLSVVVIAALGVVVSYRKNQLRQQKIMRDGGL